MPDDAVQPDPLAETDRIDPVPEGPIDLSSGFKVRLVPLQTRQLFRLLRILTHGAGAALLSSALDFGSDPEEFAGKLMAIAMMAIPDAETETIEFLASMCEPAELVKPAKRTAELPEKVLESNQALWDTMNTELFNPDPMDTLDIIERIIQAEAKDLQALGKKVGRLLKVAQATGQLKAKAAEEVPLPSPQILSESAAPSPAPLTPSAPSTAGPTTTSSTSPSADSVPLAPPSVTVGQPEPASAPS